MTQQTNDMVKLYEAILKKGRGARVHITGCSETWCILSVWWATLDKALYFEFVREGNESGFCGLHHVEDASTVTIL